MLANFISCVRIDQPYDLTKSKLKPRLDNEYGAPTYVTEFRLHLFSSALFPYAL